MNGMKQGRCDPFMDVIRLFAKLGIVFVGLAVASPSLSAELRLRESLLNQQRDAVTITVEAQVAEFSSVHPLDVQKPMSGDDCDIHMGLSSHDLRVPFVGRSRMRVRCPHPIVPLGRMPSESGLRSDRGSFTGAFRIWLEHPPKYIQTEADPEKVGNSNPPHQVELHPLTQIGHLDLRSHVTWIARDGRLGHEVRSDGIPQGPRLENRGSADSVRNRMVHSHQGHEIRLQPLDAQGACNGSCRAPSRRRSGAG